MSIKWTGGHNDSGILRKSEFKEKKEELFVFGYTCKLFRDDVKALHIDQGKHLIPWMGDDTLKIDRYDARGALHDLSALEAPQGGYDWRVELSKAEQDVELLCDEERYRAFHTDEDEEEMYKEEELKRLHAAGYGQVGFNYDVPAEPEPQTQSTEIDEPFVPTNLFQSLLPDDVVLPETQKQNAIIEKTAMFIATQGAQMEILIKAKQRDNPQFQFLNRDSNLHSYYLTLINLVKSGKWPEKKEEMVEESHPENNEYLHPSLASTAVIESAPSIPSIQYRPSADCDYTMLMCKMLDEPFAGEVAPPGVEPSQPNYAPHHIARAPVLYRMQYEAPGVQYQQPTTPIVQYQQQPLYYQQQQQQQQPAPSTAGSPTKSTGLSLMKHYNTDSDSDSDTDSSSDSKDRPTILSPPPEVQVVVDKMATYVARNGDEFAEIVRGKNDPRFTFLEPDNEYHAYYKRLMQEKRAELNGKTVKRKESKAPVSFSIKKQKEPEPILPKPALPYESSTDEDEAKTDQQTENNTTTTEVKEPPKLYPQMPMLNNVSQVVYKMEQIGSNDLPSVKTIDTGMKMLPNTVPKPVKPEVSEPKVEKVEEKTQKMLEKPAIIEAVEKKEKSVTPDERKVEKTKERHKENSERHSRKVEKSKHRDHKREYRSRSRDRESRELRRAERSSDRERRREKEKEKEREREKEKRRRYNEELESEVISLVDNSDDLIDLTGDQSDCKVSSTVVSPVSKADKAARRKRAAEFLRRAGVDPSAAALPTTSLASAMVDTLESLRKKRAEEEETRRRRDKRRHRDRRGYDDETDKSHRKSKRSKNRSSEDESDYDSSKRKKRKRDKKHSSKEGKKKKRRREAEVEDEDPQIPLNIDLTNTLKELRTSSPTKELVLQAMEEKSEKQRSPGDSEAVKRRKKRREDREYSEGEWSSDSDSDSASTSDRSRDK